MSETTEDMLNGSICQVCGDWLPDILEGEEPPGYPRKCDACKGDDKEEVLV